MTRKKFKKLLMAEGVPRNMANEMAANACANSVPYDLGLALMKVVIYATLTGQDKDEIAAPIIEAYCAGVPVSVTLEWVKKSEEVEA